MRRRENEEEEEEDEVPCTHHGASGLCGQAPWVGPWVGRGRRHGSVAVGLVARPRARRARPQGSGNGKGTEDGAEP